MLNCTDAHRITTQTEDNVKHLTGVLQNYHSNPKMVKNFLCKCQDENSATYASGTAAICNPFHIRITQGRNYDIIFGTLSLTSFYNKCSGRFMYVGDPLDTNMGPKDPPLPFS